MNGKAKEGGRTTVSQLGGAGAVPGKKWGTGTHSVNIGAFTSRTASSPKDPVTDTHLKGQKGFGNIL